MDFSKMSRMLLVGGLCGLALSIAWCIGQNLHYQGIGGFISFVTSGQTPYARGVASGHAVLFWISAVSIGLGAVVRYSSTDLASKPKEL